MTVNIAVSVSGNARVRVTKSDANGDVLERRDVEPNGGYTGSISDVGVTVAIEEVELDDVEEAFTAATGGGGHDDPDPKGP